MNYKTRGWLACITAACFFCYELIQFHMLNAISSAVIQDLNLSTTQFSTLCSTYLLADVIFLIPAGIILDRIPLKVAILSALGLCIVGTFGFALSTTFLEASISHFLSGIGNAFCFLSCMCLAKSWFSQKTAFVMSVMITIGLLGGALAQVPFTLLAKAFGWQKTLFIDALVGCFIWVLNWALVKENVKADATVTKVRIMEFFHQLKSAFSNVQIWKCGFYTGFLNLPLMIISAMIGNLYLTHSLKFDAISASFITSMISFGTIIGSPCYGLLGDVIQKKRLWMIIGATLSLICFFVIMRVQAPSLVTMVALFFALGFFSASQILGYPMIGDSSPAHLQGTSMGLAAVIIMGLAFIGQPLTGFLIEKASVNGTYNFDYALMLFPIGFVISLLMALTVNESSYELREEISN